MDKAKPDKDIIVTRESFSRNFIKDVIKAANENVYRSSAADDEAKLNKDEGNVGIDCTCEELNKIDFDGGRESIYDKKLFVPLAVASRNIYSYCEQVIRKSISCCSDVGPEWKYHLMYAGSDDDGTAKYFYFQVMFSMPTKEYPIPQATASVFYKSEQSLIHGDDRPMKMTFRMEGGHMEYDLRHVRLRVAWIKQILQMKIQLFRTLEDINIF